MYSKEIIPGNYRYSVYQNHIVETVLALKKVTSDKLSKSSVKKLKLESNALTSAIYEKWSKCGCHRDALYGKFKNKMEEPFDWVPEL